MSGLIGKAMRFARSPAGRKAMQKAKSYASSPEGKQRIEDAKERVGSMRAGHGAAGKGAPQAESAEPPERQAAPQPDPNAPKP